MNGPAGKGPVVNRRLKRMLLRLYPKQWRDRYGQEVAALTDDLVTGGDTTPRHAALELAASALTERGRVLLRGAQLVAPAVLLLAAAMAPLLVAHPVRGNPFAPYYVSHASTGGVLLVLMLGWVLAEAMALLHAGQSAAGQRWRDSAVMVSLGGWRVAAVVTVLTANAWYYLAPGLMPAAGISHAAVAFAVGVVLVIMGVAVRLWSFAARSPYLSVALRVSPDQPVTTTGPYRLIRHPEHAGTLLLCLGFGAASGNWVGLAALTVGPLVLVAWRIHIEERALAATVGDRYRRYAAQHKALVPGVW